ncbi:MULTISPECIES: phasin [Mesorhizobium]|uniref:Phasin n=2 Tax=Mesorhizobium TaxID=68287 RepID=A0ABU4Z8K4_9HYPH|nr:MULTISPECIES: phasin [unclassified Mesorhizobium]MDX8469039.1 phasin [Mesorhizobium sp. VK23B]MDX8475421.1 phasin [Mesorhizobium sp. VK23A]MDX8495540.1 phasin [Mesorhizobium sp. VK22B]MDX8515495.1 phasin [Mesorhizobium sp. VK23E]
MSKITGKSEMIENVEFSPVDPSKVAERLRAVADQSVEQSKETFSKLSSDAETAQTVVKSTFEMARTTSNELLVRTLAALQANAEAGFTHLEALVAVKSPSEFLELQAAFLRKQIEDSDEHAKALQAWMLRASEDVSKPIKDAFEKAWEIRKAA